MMLSFLLLLSLMQPVYSNQAGFGLNLGSLAAAKLVNNAAQFALDRPEAIHLDIRSNEHPWFDPIAFVDTRTSISPGPMNIRFHDNRTEAELTNLSIKTEMDISLLTLPFMGDTLHIDINVDRAYLRLKLQSMNVSMDQCDVHIKEVGLHVETSFFLNPFLSVISYTVPTRAISNHVCSAIADALMDIQSRIAVGIPFSSLIPPKFAPYLVSQNIFLYARPESLLTDNGQLTLNVAIDWYNGTIEKSSHSVFFEDTSFVHDMPIHAVPQPIMDTHVIQSTNHTDVDDVLRPSDESGQKDFNMNERLHLWVEDRLMNELLGQFRWDFKLIKERIPLKDPKIPTETREFFITLCEECFVLINMTADGMPSINVKNSSIIIEISSRVALAIENPKTKRTTTGIDLSVTLAVEFTPTFQDGVFRTRFDLLHRGIKIQNGTAAPKAVYQPLSEMLMKTISEDLWPALQQGLEPFIYKEGVRIPPKCGIKPASAQLHFSTGRVGISAALDLDNLSVDQCIQHLRVRMPSLEKMLVVNMTATAPPLLSQKQW